MRRLGGSAAGQTAADKITTRPGRRIFDPPHRAAPAVVAEQRSRHVDTIIASQRAIDRRFNLGGQQQGRQNAGVVAAVQADYLDTGLTRQRQPFVGGEMLATRHWLSNTWCSR